MSVHAFQARRNGRPLPPLESRAVWCLTCRECIQAGDGPLFDVRSCPKCADDFEVLSWRTVGLWAAFCCGVWALLIAVLVWLQ